MTSLKRLFFTCLLWLIFFIGVYIGLTAWKQALIEYLQRTN
jgi:preprotein translocase subunit SecY